MVFRYYADGKCATMDELLQRGELLTTAQVAQLLRVHPNTIRKWANSGMLRAYRLGTRGDARFSGEEIRRFIEADLRDGR